jgi:phage terminase large subunit-like protein
MGRGQGRGAFARAPDADDFGDLLVEAAAIAGAEELARFVDRLPGPVRRRMFDAFGWQLHGGQVPPAGDWRTWVVLAGRGFGKTRAGAEWVWACVRASAAPLRIALVGGSAEEAAKVMVEGPAGLLAAARTGEAPCWIPSRALLAFPGGSQAFVYSAEAPEGLRGPEHHLAWCDEFAKWRRADAAWDNLQMGLRLGARPRCAVTTTPRPVAALRRVLALSGTAMTRGRTGENVHLAPDFERDMAEVYGRTRLGRQELDGELLDDVAGALWPREVIERARVGTCTCTCPPEGGSGTRTSTCPRCTLRRVVVGVDPPASAGGDACGIVVCGEDRDARLLVLADCSVKGLRPEGWARAVAAAAEAWEADRVIAEKNNGGDMVESVLRSVEAHLPVKLVSASSGKASRAAPVAARFEAGKAFLAGRFPALEDEMAGLSWGGDYEGPGRSPDRVDAMVWAMTALMKPAPHYRIRAL